MPEGTRCQLINDKLVKSPAPTTPHARVQNKIFYEISDYLNKSAVGAEAFCAPVDVYLNDRNAFQPDILYLSKDNGDIIKRKGGYGAPDIIIEILSEDRNYDLKKKKDVYEQSGVKEYGVVDPETKWCEGFVLENNVYKSLGEDNCNLTIRMFNLSITF